MRVLYACLKIFGGGGGIENFNRNILRALHEPIARRDVSFEGFSVFDRTEELDGRYLGALSFRAFAGNTREFALAVVRAAPGANVLFIAHVNLAPVALVCKLLNPRLRVVTLAYGVEVWGRIRADKRALLRVSRSILAISEHTRNRLVADQGVSPEKTEVFPVTIDPLLRLDHAGDALAARQALGISPTAKVLLTVCRLSTRERYKGYDRVIDCLPSVLQEFPDLHYFICGKADPEEIARVRQLIAERGVDAMVHLTGYASDDQLRDYYAACDAFVMPSTGEGFGIVFLEALLAGRPVIAGNRDGSVDAVLDGKLGVLVDPLDGAALARAMRDVLGHRVDPGLISPDVLRAGVIEAFGFPAFKHRVAHVLEQTLNP